jgi:hypothetical protein
MVLSWHKWQQTGKKSGRRGYMYDACLQNFKIFGPKCCPICIKLPKICKLGRYLAPKSWKWSENPLPPPRPHIMQMADWGKCSCLESKPDKNNRKGVIFSYANHPDNMQIRSKNFNWRLTALIHALQWYQLKAYELRMKTRFKLW